MATTRDPRFYSEKNPNGGWNIIDSVHDGIHQWLPEKDTVAETLRQLNGTPLRRGPLEREDDMLVYWDYA